ncbi:MAG: efflux RND transporter periplasmic adaptor subunit [Planctomycetales bacterium]
MRRILAAIFRRASAIVVPAIAIGALLVVLGVWSPQRRQVEVSDETWTCSMHPQVRMPQPGRCPICGMTLVPLSQLATEQARMKQQAGLETEPVQHRELFKEIRTVGKLDYNERRVALITARVAGRVDRVYADFTGITVKRNDHLVDIYSPDLYTAQAELRAALEMSERPGGDRRFASASLEASRTKLRLLGILPEQIARIEKERQELTHLTLYAPIGGVVIEKNIREQQYVKEGDMLYRIAELDPIWLYLDVYEYDLGWVRYGQGVDVTVEAYPGRTFRGTVVFIDPFLDDTTRTVKVRVNLKNPGYLLKPAMYASATIHVRLQPDGTPQPTGLEGKYICPMHPEVVRDAAGRCDICEMPLEQVPALFPTHPVIPPEGAAEKADETGPALAIRKSAVLDTGRRQIAYRKRPDGAYELVELKIGPLAEGQDDAGQIAQYYPVLAGLKAGDEVVVQGGFLLDSQRQIEGMPSLLYSEGRSAAGLHAGHGGTPPAAAPATPAPGGAAPPGADDHKH